VKAILFTQYGSPDILQLTETDTPAPKDDQVLVKVLAASANPLDWHRMRGAPFLARLSDGLLKPNSPCLGADIAGRVEAVGAHVTALQPGDEVFGQATGSFAEYACAAETRLALKPANLSFEAAAAVPVAALTALQGLRDNGHIQSGQAVLINGAAGGVGSFAVQLAKAFGAEVTGVCSTRNLDLARSIGADHVVDYTQADFTRNGRLYDLIYDAVGNRSVYDCRRALRPRGVCVIAGYTSLPRLFEHMLLGPWLSRFWSQKIGLMGIATINHADLVVMKELLEAGKIAPVIDRCYPLSETPAAIRYLEQGHARGKVVIRVGLPAAPGQ
jgi:NADPH:quinone reductase-like Zn-dependent oxidoreductase